jgi:hypothetical protein
LCLTVAIEIVAHWGVAVSIELSIEYGERLTKIIVSVFADGADEGTKGAFISEMTGLDILEDLGKLGIKLVIAVELGQISTVNHIGR